MTSTKGDNEIIRRMSDSDTESTLALDRKIGRGQSIISRDDMVLIGMGGPLDLSFVCEAEGRVIGFILAGVVYVSIPLSKVCIILGIAVDPDYQRLGIGARLVQALLNQCYAQGISTTRALVDEHNVDLQHFTEQAGFRRSTVLNYDITFEYVPNHTTTRRW